MRGITIAAEARDTDALADLLAHIAGQVREGFTSGIGPTWELTGTDEVEHKVSIDEVAGDSVDTYAAKAFCDTPGCGWEGEWQHADHPDDADLGTREIAEGEAYNAAQAEGEDHTTDAQPHWEPTVDPRRPVARQ